jgi:hypothetical protein
LHDAMNKAWVEPCNLIMVVQPCHGWFTNNFI